MGLCSSSYIDIKIKLQNNTTNAKIINDATVYDLKLLIERLLNVPRLRQNRLIVTNNGSQYESTIRSNDKYSFISSFGIRENSVITVEPIYS